MIFQWSAKLKSPKSLVNEKVDLHSLFGGRGGGLREHQSHPRLSYKQWYAILESSGLCKTDIHNVAVKPVKGSKENEKKKQPRNNVKHKYYLIKYLKC